ncbi:MAG: hypothetical protein ACREH8_15230 [Opitutaceae bacterium]
MSVLLGFFKFRDQFVLESGFLRAGASGRAILASAVHIGVGTK